MKKIVALVLSLVMVLGLATTAFAAVPLYGNGTTVKYDTFNPKDNTCTEKAVEFTYHVANAPVLDAAGNVTTAGNIAYWTDAADVKYVMVDKYDSTAAFAVKAASATINVGDQTTADAMFFMIAVSAVQYGYTAVKFDAFADGCGKIAKPAGTLATDVFATMGAGYYEGDVYKMAAAAADSNNNVLLDGKVYVMSGSELTAKAHAWTVVSYIESGANKGDVDVCKCADCGVEGKWVESIYLAPSGSNAEKVFGGYVYYGVPAAPSTDKVESAQTFDAGIAMYVGMSVMAAAGSAVVLKKKD